MPVRATASRVVNLGRLGALPEMLQPTWGALFSALRLRKHAVTVLTSTT